VAGDYAGCGSTSFTGAPKSYSGWSTGGYNDFTFNATGIAAISLTGVSCFSVRNANYDVAGIEPAWSSNFLSNIAAYTADNGSNEPQLVVTYTAPSYDIGLGGWGPDNHELTHFLQKREVIPY
jgi:hypothetical protein